MFGNRITILRFCGISIGIDLSWLIIAILLSWTLAVGYFPSAFPGREADTYWLMGIVGMLGLFICIVLHELGHALVAKHYGLPISQITLFIFGGVAEIRKAPPSPKIEFWMSIAGPCVSIFLAAFLYFVTLSLQKAGAPVEVQAVTGYLAFINLVIVLFNLVPAFPLDGGRVLLSFLWWWKKNLSWAMRVVTSLGMGFGFFLIFSGIFIFILGDVVGGIWLVILGLFLRTAASSARTQFYIGKELGTVTVTKFMTKNPITVSPDCTIKDFIDHYVYESHHHLYPVMFEGRFLGYISLSEVKAIPPEQWGTKHVGDISVPRERCHIVTPETKALEALDLMRETGTSSLFVVTGDALVGLLSGNTLFKLISLKLELEENDYP